MLYDHVAGTFVSPDPILSTVKHVITRNRKSLEGMAKKWWALFVAELVSVPGVALRCCEGTVTSSSTFIDHHF